MTKYLFILIISICSSLDLYSQLRTVALNPDLAPFYHGVASGDPRPDSVIIWTRVTPDNNHSGPIQGQWRIASDTNMLNIISSGPFTTDSSFDYTVKLDIGGLQPYSYYYYDFSVNGEYSLIGRTKTAPSGDIDSLRFAVVSCAHYEAGWFNVYDAIRKKNDVDAIIHLGDYIYEYGRNEYGVNFLTDREYEPAGEVMDLMGYRTRYSQYRLDESLMKLHQQYPMMLVWDDHESANNSYKDGAENHDSGEGIWIDRKLSAVRAYKEWMPFKEQNPFDTIRIFRNIKYGDLASLIFLDTRLYGREVQMNFTDPGINDNSRTILGTFQENWLLNQLSDTTTQWKVLAQQVMMAPLTVGQSNFVNKDQWDGYPAARTRIADHILGNNIDNFVVLTGDIHTSWANDLPTSNYNSSNGNGSFGVEFITPSVTSPALQFSIPSSLIKIANPHIKYIDTSEKGYFMLDINKSRTQAEWYFINTILNKNTSTTHTTSYYVNSGERHLNSTSSISQPKTSLNAPLAPSHPSSFSKTEELLNDATILSFYPNPVKHKICLQLFIYKPQERISWSIFDIQGKLINSGGFETNLYGLKNMVIDISQNAKGYYSILLEGDKFRYSKKFIKH